MNPAEFSGEPVLVLAAQTTTLETCSLYRKHQPRPATAPPRGVRLPRAGAGAARLARLEVRTTAQQPQWDEERGEREGQRREPGVALGNSRLIWKPPGFIGLKRGISPTTRTERALRRGRGLGCAPQRGGLARPIAWEPSPRRCAVLLARHSRRTSRRCTTFCSSMRGGTISPPPNLAPPFCCSSTVDSCAPTRGSVWSRGTRSWL